MASVSLAPASPSTYECRYGTVTQLVRFILYRLDRWGITVTDQQEKMLVKALVRDYDLHMPRTMPPPRPLFDGLPDPGLAMPESLTLDPNNIDTLNAMRWFAAGIEAARAQERRPS